MIHYQTNWVRELLHILFSTLKVGTGQSNISQSSFGDQTKGFTLSGKGVGPSQKSKSYEACVCTLDTIT